MSNVQNEGRRELTPAERVLAAFEKRRISKIAVYHSGFSSRVASALLGRTAYTGGGINQWRESTALWDGPDAHAEFLARSRQDVIDLAKLAHTDMHRLFYWRMKARPAEKIDEYTFLYGDPDADYTVYRLNPETELFQIIEKHGPSVPMNVDDLEREVVEAERTLDAFRPDEETFREEMEWAEYWGPDYAVGSFGFNIAVPNRSALWIEAVAARPDLVSRLLENQCERQCRLIEAQKDLPLRYLQGGGDFCGKHGPNYSPRFFHNEMLPRLQRMSAVAHKYGKFGTFATDGDTWPVADDLWGASGVDAAHEIDRLAGMDLREMRTRFPNLTCFGNISNITLHRGSREDVIAEARDNAEAALELGGILCGVSNVIVPPTPPDNVIAMIETLEEYH